MTSDKINTPDTNVKKTAVDYVLPHNHNAIPLALDYAKQDYFNHRTYGVIEYALELGGTKAEICNRMGVTSVILDRIINDNSGGTK